MRFLFQSQVPGDFPTVEPVRTIFPKIEGADIAAVFVGNRVAGDFYDSVLTAAQSIFRNFGTELFSRPDINESEAMTELSLRINRAIIESSSGVRSCPAFIACYHEKFGTLCYTNAGHPPGLLRDSNTIAELSSGGLPLGLFSHATADAPTVGLEKGAALLLVSRGVIECESNSRRSSEEFGMQRVKQLFQSLPNGTAQEICSSVLKAADEFGGESPLCDDRTALALVRTA